MVASALNMLVGWVYLGVRAMKVLEIGGRTKARRSKSINFAVVEQRSDAEAGGEIYLMVTLINEGSCPSAVIPSGELQTAQ